MENENNTSAKPHHAEWGVVELIGHCTMAGLISEIEMFGGMMGHILTPYADGKTVVRLFNRNNIYRLTLCDEATARRVIQHGYLPDDGYFTADDIERMERPASRPVGRAKEDDYDEDADRLDGNVTAMNNRMARLWKMGLLQRRQQNTATGRCFVYSRNTIEDFSKEQENQTK